MVPGQEPASVREEREKNPGSGLKSQVVTTAGPGIPSTGEGVWQLKDEVGQRGAPNRVWGWGSDRTMTGEPGTALGTDINRMCQSGIFLP